MTAEVVLDVEISEFVEWLAEKHGATQLLHPNEWNVLKPRLVDDYLEVKILVSDEGSPRQWVGYDKIKKEWEETI